MKTLSFLFALLYLSACASNLVWTKPGFTQAEFGRDKAKCDYETSAATQNIDYTYRTTIGRVLDQAFRKADLMKKCFRARGYYQISVEPPQERSPAGLTFASQRSQEIEPEKTPEKTQLRPSRDHEALLSIVGGSTVTKKTPVMAPKVADSADQQSLLRGSEGNAEAEFQLYSVYDPSLVNLNRLCLAAYQGHALAQKELGDLYTSDRGQRWRDLGLLKLDRVRGYMWYRLAAEKGLQIGADSKALLYRKMSSQQIYKAVRLADNWKSRTAGLTHCLKILRSN